MTNKVMVPNKQYEINVDTMALLPFCDEYGKLHTKVLERNRTLCVCGKPKSVITFSCGYYGSSYKGRKDGASHIMGIRSRAPIVISEQLGIFFIPLESPNNDTCIWIAQAHVKQVKATSSDTSDIIFSNDTFISVNQAKSTLEAKIHRASHYRFILELRINEKKTIYAHRFFRP
ncbi:MULTISPECIES: competence protein ComK [unclassified Fictibacillus]|uniref:competence protein ComK n=1 Tax=unclassified Fictibacillus TaxID=2644029 RepID=UPI0006A7CB48|nr:MULTISPECIES: competence protein ComK [unclassified Fictibacillus]MED2971893.1 competence protein ComK [Fictibacillus sp. B-59209]UZJ77689.1 competence protein ComK [Fictibacillus sp. KU28468]SFD99018.1 competence protein ComK [Bacillus sp. OV194]